MDVQQFLANEKQKFIHQGKEERKKYFSSSSRVADFSNSQIFFFMFSQEGGYLLHKDGEFSRMCSDMEKFLGRELYSELMENLSQLRQKKVAEIKNNAPAQLMHISNVPPDKMGNKIVPKSNLNQFGEKRDNFVFATESDVERDFYALRVNDKEGKNINWKMIAEVDGNKKPVFIMEKLNHDSYTYFVSKSSFEPVVSLDGRFGHEWTSTAEVVYSSCEKNRLEDIKKRNIVKIVDRNKFLSQKSDFYKKLKQPKLVLETLEKSDVLKEKTLNNALLEIRKGKEV